MKPIHRNNSCNGFIQNMFIGDDERSIRIATDFDDFPLLFANEHGFDGINVRLLKTLGSKMNISQYYVDNENGLWGSFVNGSWNGLLGMIAYEPYNITVNYFTLTNRRIKSFDFSRYYMFDGFGVALLRPPRLNPGTRIVHPLTSEVWYSIFVFTFFVFLFIHCISRVLNKPRDSPSFHFLLVLKGLVNQSIGHSIESSPLRLILAFWWIASMVLAMAYTGNLIAVLTIPLFPKQIETLEELANSKLRVSMIDYGEFVPVALKNSADQSLSKLGNKMNLMTMYPDDVYTYETLVQELLGGESAIIETNSYLRNLVRSHPEAGDKAYFLKEVLYRGALVLYLKKNTPWLYKLNDGIERLVESGIINFWYKDIMKTRITVKNNGAHPEAINIYYLQGPFLLLGLGLLLAIIVFVLEQLQGHQFGYND